MQQAASDRTCLIVRKLRKSVDHRLLCGVRGREHGKRKRNRSNVEAMTAKHMMNDDIDDDSGNGGGSIETAKDPDASTVVTGSSVAERAIGGGGDHNGE